MPHHRFHPAVFTTAAALSLAAVFVAPPLTARAQETAAAVGVLPAKGPLPLRDPEPLITPFLQPLPTDASVLDTGERRWDINLDIVNNLLTVSAPAQNRRYLTDFEEQRLAVGYARGLGRGQEVGIRALVIARNGGIFDSFINSYHKVFGFEGGGRANLPNRRVLFQVNDANGRTIVDKTDGASGLGDTVIEYRKALTPFSEEADTHRLAASARALVKLPTGSKGELFGSGAVDAAGGLALTWRPARRVAVHGNLSLVLLGKPKIPNLQVRRTSVQSMVAAEYLFDGRTSLLLQSDDAPAPFASGISYPDRPRRAFTFGFWRQIGERDRAYLSLAENDFGPLANHAPDFVLSTGLRRRF
jgi:hypothetical protein